MTWGCDLSGWPFVFDWLKENLTDEQIDAALKRWIDYSVSDGVSAVFDSGIPGFNESMRGSMHDCASWMRRESFRCI